MEFSRIFIPWNTIISSSHEIQSYLHPMNFSNIFFSINSVTFFHPIKFSHMFIPKTQSQFHSMKCRHIFTPWNSVANQSQFTRYSYAVTVFIPWNSVRFASHEIQSHLHSMKFSHICISWNQSHFSPMKYSYILMTWNSVATLISWYAPIVLIQTDAATFSINQIQSHLYPMIFTYIHIPWTSVTGSCLEIQSHLHSIRFKS